MMKIKPTRRRTNCRDRPPLFSVVFEISQNGEKILHEFAVFLLRDFVGTESGALIRFDIALPRFEIEIGAVLAKKQNIVSNVLGWMSSQTWIAERCGSF